jgi:hypothetical protein
MPGSLPITPMRIRFMARTVMAARPKSATNRTNEPSQRFPA